MSGYIVDTSIFIAAEQGRGSDDPPQGLGRVSVVTLTELRVGLLAARGRQLKRVREATLERSLSFIALPFDEAASMALARLIHTARTKRRRAPFQDAIIAATALVHDLTVWTQDADFDVLAELEPKLRVHRA